MTRWLLLAALCCASTPAAADEAPHQIDLAHATIEELMRIEVTSASRKEQRATDAPAAVFVITAEDIRRSGAQSLPDVLRLAPGVEVARINANNWAISVRGFNNLFANKVLVMIDGRTVYNPLFGGVFWDSTDLPIDDIERIEVVRGPGGAVWGANAVNGVINVITRQARDTQGMAARVRVGTGESGEVSVRYGGALHGVPFRVFSQATSNGLFDDRGPGVARDTSSNVTGGARIDWPTVTLDGSLTAGESGALWLDFTRLPQVAAFPQRSQLHDGHLLGRWTPATNGPATLQLQSFVDVTSRREPIGTYQRRTVDADLESRLALGARHDVVVGGGYRFIDERFTDGADVRISPSHEGEELLNVFAQDEVALRADRRVRLTLGAKAQYSDVTGANVSPTARAMWSVVPDAQQAWAAVSRAVRTPSMLDRNLLFDMPYGLDPTSGLPLVYEVRGNPDVRAETVDEVEAGYRVALTSIASIDVAVFGARYDHLRTNELLAPQIELGPQPRVVMPHAAGNLLSARTRGAEISGRWDPWPAVHVDGQYSLFHYTPFIDPASRDVDAAVSDGNAPASQSRLHASVRLARGVTVDGAVSHTGSLGSLGIPAYSRADVQIEWPLSRTLALDVIGQNPSAPDHLEFYAFSEFVMATPVPRSAHVQLRMVF